MESSLRSRVLTASIGVPLLILLVGWGPPWVFVGLFVVLNPEALREYFAMAFPGSVREQFWGVLFGLSLSLVVLFSGVSKGELGLSLLFVLFFSIYLFMAGKLQERLNRLAWKCFSARCISVICCPIGCCCFACPMVARGYFLFSW